MTGLIHEHMELFLDWRDAILLQDFERPRELLLFID